MSNKMLQILYSFKVHLKNGRCYGNMIDSLLGEGDR